jgi:precorrin-2/cobalt-factor-2 C20-methyltransferase
MRDVKLDKVSIHRKYLCGVGVGPGDPKLLTLAAVETIKSADLVLAPTSAQDEPGRAEEIVRKAIGTVPVRRILFDMAKGESGIELRKSTALVAAKEIVTLLQPGERAAFLTIGDPNVFSTFNLLARSVASIDPTVEISSIPGIMAFQDLVSRSGMTLLDEEESLKLLVGLQVDDRIEEALKDSSSAVVIYKGGRNLPAIVELAKRAGRLADGWIGVKIGLEESEVTRLQNIGTGPVGYLSTIIFPPRRH